jgi:transcriptional regulator with XRE-family HTH domain
MREARGWSQGQLAEKVGMAQPRISVLEGGYESYSMTTLKRFASAFDVAVVIRFIPFSELVNWAVSASEEQLAPVPFANDNLTEEMPDEEEARPAAAASQIRVQLSAAGLPSAPSTRSNVETLEFSRQF